MSFSIKKYYAINNSINLKEIINIIISDLNANIDTINSVLEQINKDPSFIYPQDCWLSSKKIKDFIIIFCIMLEKITQNPIFILNAETFYRNEKISTIDVFFFFAKIFSSKLDEKIFDLSVFKTLDNLYETNLNKKYNLSIRQMLSIDDKMFVLDEKDKLFEAYIK